MAATTNSVTAAVVQCASICLSIVSFNMHGFNQGRHVVHDLIKSQSPDIFLLQEHWLTPANLHNFAIQFPDYVGFGKSAMECCLESGPLKGRPYGGVITLVKQNLANKTEILNISDRYVLVKISDYAILNMYLPCIGTTDRVLIIDDILREVETFIENMSNITVIVGGDINMDLNKSVDVAATSIFRQFMSNCNLKRCDELCNKSKIFTHANDALGHYSCIDYFLVSDASKLLNYAVIEPDLNLSDHLPITACFTFIAPAACHEKARNNSVVQLRWDQADLQLYYDLTGSYLQDLLHEFTVALNDDTIDDNEFLIDNTYNKLVYILQNCARITVPHKRKNFFKFWWSQELDCLKEAAIKSHQIWKAAGKPRSGACFSQMSKDKSTYKSAIRDEQAREKSVYSNDLHEALLQKENVTFWNCWRSKFGSKDHRPHQVDGLVDETEISNKFAEFFSEACSPRSIEGAQRLKDLYNVARPNYIGAPYTSDLVFDASLVENVVVNMRRGKAAGLDGLSAEHLLFCHPCLPLLLSKLFNLAIESGKVPHGFGLSYTIPLLKGSNLITSKSLTVNDFRGISISPVLSKVFEYCVINKYSKFLLTSHNQFGFKKHPVVRM